MVSTLEALRKRFIKTRFTGTSELKEQQKEEDTFKYHLLYIKNLLEETKMRDIDPVLLKVTNDDEQIVAEKLLNAWETVDITIMKLNNEICILKSIIDTKINEENICPNFGQIEEKDPKLLYCKNCDLKFNSYEKDMYTIVCPYCDKMLNEQTIDEYYRFLRISLEQLN